MLVQPGTGSPDGEVRAMPHGDTLDNATGQTATVGGLVLDNAGDGWHVAAYRSLVVVVINNGVHPINVTPRWSFWAVPPTLYYTEETQTVPAQTHKRLLFQNQADWVEQITFTGVGGSSSFAYYITGSNLDPLARSTLPALYLTGSPVQSYASGVGFNYIFDQVGAGNSHNTDPTIYEYNTVAPGQTDTVDVLQPGLYLVHAGFHYNLPAADSHWEFGIVPVNSDAYPSALPTQQSGTDKGSVFASAAVLWSVQAASVGFPQNQLQVSGLQTSGGLVVVDSGWLHIVRLTATPP